MQRSNTLEIIRFKRNKALVLLLLVLGLCSVVKAQDPDGQSPTRGFQPNGAYALGEIESISLAGGNMTYSLPLASLPPSRGGRLKPAVYLLYNSKLFDTRVRMCLGVSCSFTYVQTDLVPSSFGGWTYGTNYFVLTTNRATNYIDGAPPPWNQYKYKTEIFFPDGSSHQLRPSNQAPTDEYYTVSPGSPGTTRTYYTTDGSYVRVEFSADGASWTLYFRDGSTVNYNNSNGVQTTTDGNGNFYTTQNVTLQNGNPATVVTDQVNRKITIEKPVSGPHYVRVNGFGGPELVTTINWGTTSPQGKKWLWKEFTDSGIQVFKTSVTVRPVITSISLPNGLNYQFEYNSDVFDPLNPTKSVGWGELYKTTLPTGATAQYAYSMDNHHGNETDDIIEPKQVTWDYPNSKQLTYTDSYDGVNTQRTDTWSYSVNIIEGGAAEGQTQTATSFSPDGGVSSENFFVNLTGDTSFGKAGLSYKSVRPDSSQVERYWQENIPYNGSGKTKNFYVKTEFVSIPNSTGTLVKTAIKDYLYDKNGNVTQIAEYDWVPYGDIGRDGDGKPTGAIPGSAQLKRVTATGFYNQTPSADSGAYSAAIYNLSTAPNLRSAAQWSEIRSSLSPSSALSRVEFDYDDPSSRGNLITKRSWDSTKGSRTDPLTPSNSISVSTQYDSYGNPTLATDARLTQTQFVYDPVGGFADLYPTQVKTGYQTSIQRTESREYDFDTGVVTRVTDVDNNVSTSTGYDAFCRPVLVKAAEGKTEETRTSTEYSDLLRRVIIRSDLNTVGDGKLVSIQHYDQLGRLRLSRRLEDSASESATDESTGIKVQTRYLYSGTNSYQLVSNPYRATTSGGAGSEQSMGWTRNKMDVAGRVLEVQTFGGATLPSPWGTSSMSSGTLTTTYDAEFTTVADQLSKLRRSMINALGQLVRVDEPTAGNNLGSTTAPNQATNYSFDALGNLVSVAQGSQTRTFAYSSLSLLTSATNPESGTINYTYDNNGNLSQKTDARGVVSNYTYDALNRNTAITYANDPSGTLPVTRVYDTATNGIGRLYKSETTGTNGSRTTVDSYDALGRPTAQRQEFYVSGAWSQPYLTQRTYDLADNVRIQTYPSGRTANYNYDSAGRLSSFTGNLGDGTTRTYSTGITYAAAGQLTQEQFATTVPVYNKLFYNSRQQLAEILVSTTGGDTSWNRGRILNQYSLQCSGAGCIAPDNNGNLRKQEVYIPADEQISSYTSWYQQYEYDDLNRLQRVNEYTGNPTLDWQQEFVYDRWGNRTIHQTNTWGTGIPKPNFGVDTTTNRLTAPAGYSMSYDPAGNLITDNYSGGGSREYDAENRMTKAWGGNDQWQYYSYDADGHRTRRKIDGQETWQIYFDGELLAEYLANGGASSPQKEYGYRNGQLLVTAEPRSNVALASAGAVATASSAHTCCGFSTGGAINGNNRGPWGNGDGWNDATPDVLPDWLQVDFAGSKTIDEIDVYSLHDNYTTQNTPTESQTFTLYGLVNFEVQYWNGSSWVTVPGGSVTGNNKVWRKFTFAPITTSKIRVWITGVPDSWSRIVEVEAYAAAGSGTATINWLVPDQLGTPRMIVDQTGSLSSLKRHDYLPFGEELYAGVGSRTATQGYSGDLVRQKFTSKQRDNETGLDYFGARYYASMQGRFVSADPLLSSSSIYTPQSWNRYSYSGNNPLRYTDPFGLYVYGPHATPDERKKFEAGMKKAREAIKKLDPKSDQYKNLERALNAYGAKGVDNGVTVGFGPNKDGAPAATVIGIQADSAGIKVVSDDNPTGQNTVVTIDLSQNKDSSALAESIGHEGSHVADGATLVSILPSNLSASAGILTSPFNLTKYQTESRAYRVSAAVAQGLGYDSLTIGKAKYEIWNSGWKEADRPTKQAAGIDKVLAEPKSNGGFYEVTPTNQGNRLIEP